MKAWVQWVGVLGLALFSQAVLAVDRQVSDDLFCRNGGFAEEQSNFALAKVIGKGHLNLLGNMNGCPREAVTCRGFGYVMPGDVVVTGRSHGDYVCVYYPNHSGGSAGWASHARLAVLPVNHHPTMTDWVGTWRDGDNTISISLRHGKLHAIGEAYWPAANPTPDEAPGGPNTGSFNANVAPRDNRVQLFNDDDPKSGCRVNLTLIGHLLIANDNMGCGGLNVRFRSVYVRR